jgi:hypothetical protein
MFIFKTDEGHSFDAFIPGQLKGLTLSDSWNISKKGD